MTYPTPGSYYADHWWYQPDAIRDRIRRAEQFKRHQRVIIMNRRWGKVCHITSMGLVAVFPWSPTLERFTYTTVSYHPDHLKAMVN